MSTTTPREDPPVAESVGEEPQATLYCRCPLSLAVRLRTLAFERSKGKRRRVTQNDLLIEAIERFLNAEGV
jgi:hypothetical protein